MNSRKTHLFVIIDPHSEHQNALVKAMIIARLGDCHIHAFMCVYAELAEHGESASRKDLKNDCVKQAKSRLKDFLEPCRQSGIPVSSEVIWNSHWYDAALRSITRSGCDLVIKSSFHHSRARRFFGKTSDYTLMRYSPSPIMFTHQSQQWESDRLLACLDLESADAQHRKLNNAIISNARTLCDILAMDLNIATVDAVGSGCQQVQEKERADIVAQLAEVYDVANENIFLGQGAVVQCIEEICAEIDPDIVIIGSIARTGISGKLIGNTAEKLIDQLDADLLTVN